MKVVSHCLKKLYKPTYYYQKVGIMLLDFNSQQQMNFGQERINRREKVMETMDKINNSFGNRSIFLASSGVEQKWAMRRESKSPSYTTNWDELLIVK